MELAPQEIVMRFWLLIAGFNMDAVKNLDEANAPHPSLSGFKIREAIKLKLRNAMEALK